MTETQIQQYESQAITQATLELDTEQVANQVAKIQTIMHKVMRDGEHYGVIPGCGKKPALLKSGAEKIGFTFRLVPRYIVERIDYPGTDHREYVVTCELTHMLTGSYVGAGVGSCSTKEKKYRYRTGAKVFTGEPVPAQYWNLRKSDPAKAQESLGGPGYTVGKDDAGQWQICKGGEQVEHDNPSDFYNTVLKMAKKRAHVDAILTATAASDIFTQDIEDLQANGVLGRQEEVVAEPEPEQPDPEAMRQQEKAEKKEFEKVALRKSGVQTLTPKELRSILLQCQAFSHIESISGCAKWLDKNATVDDGRVMLLQANQVEDDTPDDSASPQSDMRKELESICICCAAVQCMPVTKDYRNYTLERQNDVFEPDDVCMALSAFKGKDGKEVQGRTIDKLSDKALAITLTKARSLQQQLLAVQDE